MAERALSIREINAEYGVDRAWVSRLIHSGELPAVQRGRRRWLILRRDWEDFLRRKAVRPETDPVRVVEERLARKRAAS
jgi:excisionase family DNA binding protein